PDLADPDEGAQERVPEADRAAVVAHDADAERELAERPPARERLDRRRDDDHDEHGDRDADRGREGGVDELERARRGPQERDQHDEDRQEVEEQRQAARHERRRPRVEDHALADQDPVAHARSSSSSVPGPRPSLGRRTGGTPRVAGYRSWTSTPSPTCTARS